MYSSQESLVQAFSCEFWKNFKNIYVVEHLWTHTCREMKQWKNVFTEICSQKNTGEGVV